MEGQSITRRLLKAFVRLVVAVTPREMTFGAAVIGLSYFYQWRWGGGLSSDWQSVVVPGVWAVCLFATPLLLLAARDVRREDLKRWAEYKPYVIHPENQQPKPSVRGVVIAAIVALCLPVLLVVLTLFLPAPSATTSTAPHPVSGPAPKPAPVIDFSYSQRGFLPIVVPSLSAVTVVTLHDDGQARILQHSNSGREPAYWPVPRRRLGQFADLTYLLEFENQGDVSVFDVAATINVRLNSKPAKDVALQLPSMELRTNAGPVAFTLVNLSGFWVELDPPSTVDARVQGEQAKRALSLTRRNKAFPAKMPGGLERFPMVAPPSFSVWNGYEPTGPRRNAN